MKAKIAVLVSGGGTNLQALIDSVKKGIIHDGEIAVVISSKDSVYALTRADNYGIPRFVIKRKDNTQSEFETAIIEILQKFDIDLIVLAGFLCVFSENFTKLYTDRIINVHPSLIPKFCGKGFYGISVHEQVLKSGDKYTGATVHYVNEITDGGKIIMQKKVRVKKNDTANSLQKRVMEKAEWKLLPKVTQKLCAEIVKGKN